MGDWTYRGGPLPIAERWTFAAPAVLSKVPSADGTDVVLVEQRSRAIPRPTTKSEWSVLMDRLTASSARVWLLDEPTAEAPETYVEGFKTFLREARSSRDIVLVSHDQSLVRECADVVCILGDGQLEMHDASRLFADPVSPLASAYVRTGTSWLGALPEPPGLPTHFHWVLEDRLGGMGRPGLNRDIEDDLAALGRADVKVLISLTEAPLPANMLRAFGIEARHFPIRDMGFPPSTPAARLCKFVETRLKAGDRVVFHCHAGLGRTGTMLAATLVWMGADAGDAIARVRTVNPGFIQTVEQERFLQRFQVDVS